MKNFSSQRTFLGLPNLALNFLSFGGGVFLIMSGLKVMESDDVSLRFVNAQLITNSSADKLQSLADELDASAELIKQKDEAYQQLNDIYARSLKGKDGYGKLQDAIETVGELPQVQELDSIQTEILITKEKLGELQP